MIKISGRNSNFRGDVFKKGSALGRAHYRFVDPVKDGYVDAAVKQANITLYDTLITKHAYLYRVRFEYSLESALMQGCIGPDRAGRPIRASVHLGSTSCLI